MAFVTKHWWSSGSSWRVCTPPPEQNAQVVARCLALTRHSEGLDVRALTWDELSVHSRGAPPITLRGVVKLVGLKKRPVSDLLTSSVVLHCSYTHCNMDCSRAQARARAPKHDTEIHLRKRPIVAPSHPHRTHTAHKPSP